MSKRTAIELAVGAVSIALAVVLLLAMLDVRRWEKTLTRGDARFDAAAFVQTPAFQVAAPPPFSWHTPRGFAATISERLLGVRDDVAYRHAMALYRSVAPGPNEQIQYQNDPELPARRLRAQQALLAVSRNDPSPVLRSRAVNMLGILVRSGPTPANPQEQRNQIVSTINLFRSAIAIDPNNADAKLNLELVLTDPQTLEFVSAGAGQNRNVGSQAGKGEGGQGY